MFLAVLCVCGFFLCAKLTVLLRSFVCSFSTNSDTFGVCLLSLVYPGRTNEGRGRDDPSGEERRNEIQGGKKKKKKT